MHTVLFFLVQILLCSIIQHYFYFQIDWLSLMGGNTPGESVRRLLRKLGTNALWAQYSLKGRKGKKNFQELEICNVIILELFLSCFLFQTFYSKSQKINFIFRAS